MPEFLDLSNLTAAELGHGIKATDIPGGKGIVSAFFLIISVNGITPGNLCVAAILAPILTPVSSEGPADDFGGRSISFTWVRGADDTHWNSSQGAGIFPDGFWGLTFRGNVGPSDPGYFGEINIEIFTTDVLLFTQDLTNGTDVPMLSNQTWDGSKGTVTLDIHYDDSLSELPDSIGIIRDGVAIGNIPVVVGVTDYSFIDVVFAAGDYSYSSNVYKYPDSRSAASASAPITFGGLPIIDIVGDITFSMSLVSVIIINTDPSGIYKLTSGLQHDTLYNRSGSEDTTDVAIPEPFIVTAFIPND